MLTKMYQRKNAKPINCKFCGKPVEYHTTALGQRRRYHYHENCLIDAAINAILNGEKFTKGASRILTMAANRGYRKDELVEIMNEMECRNNE